VTSVNASRRAPDAEQSQLVETLGRNQNNRSVTAAALGISRTALYKKLKKYHLL
jgi:transcriptional regulator of acetoin/glycerol metabolism